MLRTRVIPCLLLEDEALVKTTCFKNPLYIGDPINSVRIYNELEVDELIFLDIKASKNAQKPPFKIIAEIASECFMPFSYGGGIKTLDDAKQLFDLGVEKVVLNTAVAENPKLISDIARAYGDQSIIIACDVKKSFLGTYYCYIANGSKKIPQPLLDYVSFVESLGIGEILVNSIDCDGKMSGFDTKLIQHVSSHVSVPVIALGGAGELSDLAKAKEAGASAIGLGSMAVFQNKSKGILINFPTKKEILKILNEK